MKNGEHHFSPNSERITCDMVAFATNKAPTINITPDQMVRDPFPHVIAQPFLPPDFYRQLRQEFPTDQFFLKSSRRLSGRTGRDFYRGDPEFTTFLGTSPAWKQFYEYINSPQFLQFTLTLFEPYLKDFGCRVDARQAQLIDYTESRFSLWKHKLRAKKASILGYRRQDNPNQLYTRFDIEQATDGYAKPVHCDWPNRLVSLILYFSDPDKIGMQGGDLRIHEHREEKPYTAYERLPREEHTRVIRTIRPRENLGVFFLCTNNSYHSVTAVRSISDYRRFIYLNVSSTANNIW